MACQYKSIAVLVVALGLAAAETKDFLQGLNAFGKIVRQNFNSDVGDVKLADGVHLVTSRSDDGARAFVGEDSNTVLGATENFLRNHEIKIKMGELLPGHEFGRAFKDAVESSVGTGRGKNKGGGGMGGLLIMGAMMAKMMAALGLGGIGALAMKALMTSALALMLSMIIGLKKLVSSGGDDSGHKVIYASSHEHHRKKREAAEMAYSSWNN